MTQTSEPWAPPAPEPKPKAPLGVKILAGLGIAAILAIGGFGAKTFVVDKAMNGDTTEDTFWAQVQNEGTNTIARSDAVRLGHAFCGSLDAGASFDDIARQIGEMVIDASDNIITDIAVVEANAVDVLCPKYAPQYSRYVDAL